MIDVPYQSDIVTTPSHYELQTCINYASKTHKVPPLVVKAIVQVEGGKIGTVSKNTNGTYDLGIMQINTIHLPYLQKKYPRLEINWKTLSRSVCLNIFLATSILKDRLNEIKDLREDFWIGVGNYHSKTPSKRLIYLRKVHKQLQKITKNRR